jgi:GNAT superfamily N-acetyltransferase
MNELEVRELKAGEELLWLELDDQTDRDGDPSESERLAAFRERFEDKSSEDPRTFLLALDGSRPAGRLEGVFLDSTTYAVAELRCAEGLPCSLVEDALIGHLTPSFSRDGIGVVSSNRPKNVEINMALERAGFEIEKKKAFVARDLTDGLPEPAVEFTFRTLFDVGKVEFLRVMTGAAEGDPFEDVTGRDPEADFNELVEAAGSKFDPAGWMLAHVGGEAVGVVLPQEFSDSKAEGTLFYVAVLPPFRGRGYGRALHATGLAMLAERGVTGYVGSTDTRNEPMLRVFEANGCPQTATQFFYRPPTEARGK